MLVTSTTVRMSSWQLILKPVPSSACLNLQLIEEMLAAFKKSMYRNIWEVDTMAFTNLRVVDKVYRS